MPKINIHKSLKNRGVFPFTFLLAAEKFERERERERESKKVQEHGKEESRREGIEMGRLFESRLSAA